MQTKQKNKSPLQNDDSLFTQMLAKYLTYWPLFLLFIALALGGAFVYLRYATPKYEATASLIIKDEKKGNDDSKLMESLNMISTKKIIENEIEVLQSRAIVDNVVDKLHLYAPIYQDGKIKAVSAYMASPVNIEAMTPDSLKTSGKIYIQYDASKGTIILNNQYGGAINEWLNTPFGTLKFTPNNKYISTGRDKAFYFTLCQPKVATQRILGNLKVTASNKLSSVIALAYRDIKPELAQDILNEIIIAYNSAAVSEKNSLARNTLTFLEQRLAVVGKDLDSIEQKIQQYKAGAGAVDIGTQGQLFLQNVSTNDQKLSEMNMQLSVINQLEKHVTSPDNSSIGIMPSTLGVTDPSLSQLMTSLNAAELEREKLKKTVAENNPMLLAVTDQIEKIKPNILENIQSQRKNLESGRTNLYATNSKYNAMLHTIPVKERQLLEISRDQNIKSGIYSFLLQKREESELSYAATISDSRLVNYAQASNSPVSPNKLLILGAAVAFGIALPIVLVRARELLSRTIMYRQEIEGLTSIPIIGEVAHNKTGKSLVVESGKRSFIAEEFRKIRFSLLYLGVDANRKKVLLTSSISGEGKSFIAANLAISFSLTGKKVVLVDLDLHNSSLGKMFDKEDAEGVSNYMVGEKNMEDIIGKVPAYENLYFIPAGSQQDDPSELLENGRVQKLITYLENSFDLVIIDTAPVVLVTDAHVLSALCDATLYIVRHKYTPKMLLKRFDENNEINPLTNPAIIFNGIKTRGFFKNNYGYGYGYVYGDKNYNKKDKKKKKVTV